MTEAKISNRLLARLPLEPILLLTTVALGCVQAWVGRYSMNPDGMSYLDVGDSFFQRDWAHAVNAWWSPLYPWLLGVAVGVAKPSPKWEFPLVHAVNLAIFVIALFAFHFLLRGFLDFRRERASASSSGDVDSLPDWALLLIAYPIFWWTALEIETVYEVSPDLAVLACLCLPGGHALAAPERRQDLEVRGFRLDPRTGILDENHSVPHRPGDSRGQLLVETVGTRLALPHAGSWRGLPVRVRAADFPSLKAEASVHIWRFRKVQLRLVRIATKFLEKLAGSRTRQRDAGASHAAITGGSACV